MRPLHVADLWKSWQGVESVSQVTFHSSYAYEDFIEGFRPDSAGKFMLRSGIFVDAYRDARRFLKRKFLLIIDELNRADVARIFGELITLIERDKRDVRASRKLPYSREEFHVPPNLYLLGTMNTADRSISLRDVAILRRFCFVEFAPDSAVINGSEDHHQLIDSIDLGQLMLMLNLRLQQIGVERDRALGHSHFLIRRNGTDPLAELRGRIRHDIVPLIEEYCYANRSQMTAVLGGIMRDGLIAEDVLEDDVRLVFVDHYDYRALDEVAEVRGYEMGVPIFSDRLKCQSTCNFSFLNAAQIILHLRKGKAKLFDRPSNMIFVEDESPRVHLTQFPTVLLTDLITSVVAPGAVV